MSTDSTIVVEPNFLYIGFAKTGSTWIFEALNEHPQVFVPSVKDLRFFEDDFYSAQRYVRYLRHFANGQDKLAVGELSHNYILSEKCAERIKYHLPEVRLLICLREPGEWIVSAYRYARLFRKEASDGLTSYRQNILDQLGILNIYENLSAYYTRFPADNIHVMFYEDLRQQPETLLIDLYTFLGIDNSFQPSILHTRINAARSSRFGNRVTQSLNTTAQMLRRLGMESVVGYLKHNPQINRLIFSNEPQPIEEDIDDQVQRIREDCAIDYPKLETLIGRKLPAKWYESLLNG